jgi:hypothetical protein
MPFPETAVMNLRDSDGMFNRGEVCGAHGDECLQECTVCGAEFCRRCSPGTVVCPDCAGAEPGNDPEDEEIGDELDPALERLLAETGRLPNPDAADR